LLYMLQMKKVLIVVSWFILHFTISPVNKLLNSCFVDSF
jgi:hypothetical protein